VAWLDAGFDFKSRASASFATRAGQEMVENTISVHWTGLAVVSLGLNRILLLGRAFVLLSLGCLQLQDSILRLILGKSGNIPVTVTDPPERHWGCHQRSSALADGEVTELASFTY
jgi:hypothetical protein